MELFIFLLHVIIHRFHHNYVAILFLSKSCPPLLSVFCPRCGFAWLQMVGGIMLLLCCFSPPSSSLLLCSFSSSFLCPGFCLFQFFSCSWSNPMSTLIKVKSITKSSVKSKTVFLTTKFEQDHSFKNYSSNFQAKLGYYL